MLALLKKKMLHAIPYADRRKTDGKSSETCVFARFKWALCRFTTMRVLLKIANVTKRPADQHKETKILFLPRRRFVRSRDIGACNCAIEDLRSNSRVC